MKKRIQLLLGATLMTFLGLGQAFGQVSKASDEASNYSSWSNGDNQGYGFGSWSISSSGGSGGFAGAFLGNPSTNSGITGLPSSSFSLYAHSDGGAFVNADRTFNSLTSSDTLRFKFGINWDSNGGNKGINIYSGGTSGTQLLNINNASTDDITINGATMFDNYGTNAVELTVIYISDTNIRVFGTGRDGSETYDDTLSVSSGTPDAIRFYSSGQGSNNDNRNLHFNNLEINSSSLTANITGSAGFRLMSSPVTTSYSDILDEIWTQGASAGADVTNGDPNVFGWKWNVLSPEWETLTNLSANVSTGIGFLVYVFADDDYDGAADAFPKTLSVSGTEHSGDVEPDINTDNDVYQLFGNPYASTIDFDDITKTNLTNVAYVWDPNAGGSGEWETWNGTTGDLTDGLIAPFQGFFVQTASSGTPDITIGEASKSSNGSFLGKVVEEPQKVRFEVEGNGLSNSAFLEFGINGSPTEKVIGDAEELTSLSSSFAQLSFSKADGLFDIANIGNPTEEVTIPLDFTSSTGGLFTLSATDFDVTSSYDLTFHDFKTGESLLIDESFSYTFETQRLKPQEVPPLTSLTAWAAKAKSSDSNRFGITIAPGTSVSIDDELNEVTEFALDQNYPNPFNPTTNIKYSVGETGPVNITVYNVMGQKVAELLNTTKNAGSYQLTWNATGVASGIYYYRLTAPGQVLTRQMTLIK